jgi:hypothetical protein
VSAPGTGGYRYQGDGTWTPNDPRCQDSHRTISPKNPNSTEARVARLAVFTGWREKKLCLAESARLAGISVKTGQRYERERLDAARAQRNDRKGRP